MFSFNTSKSISLLALRPFSACPLIQASTDRPAEKMGKSKQAKGKKFDRNVEISAPILDPDMIRAIHSPPKDKKLDIRHGGFKALLSDSQDSTDELAPIATENHLPSYIGISCAVSGYSNYSSYNRRPLEDISSGNETKAARLNTSNSRLTATPNRSHTSSPTARRDCQHHIINHVTIDRSAMGSPDQERRELTEKLTASVTERRRVPSPPPPIEDERHHGAYVGARYFPMPEPSKLVHKHIPLLGIDDDQDPDQFVADETNKMEKQIANLYGDEFVEDWKESMRHKSKKETPNVESQQAEEASKNLKDLVTLKPTPPRAPEPLAGQPRDVPTPDIKVLAGVEKQFLNRLLTDENPPMPRSPSPEASKGSPVTPRYSRPVVSPSSSIRTAAILDNNMVDSHESAPSNPAPPSARSAKPASPVRDHRGPSPEAAVVGATSVSDSPTFAQTAQKEESGNVTPPPALASPQEELEPEADHSLIGQAEATPDETPNCAGDAIVDEQLDATRMDEPSSAAAANAAAAARADHLLGSPDSMASNSTVEEAGGRASVHREEHIEYEIRTQSPANNESSPVRALESDQMDSFVQSNHQEQADLIGLSPEPTEAPLSSEYNNNVAGTTKLPDPIDLIEMDNDDLLQFEPPTRASPGGDTVALAPDAGGQDAEPKEVVKDGRYFLSILRDEESFIMGQAKLAEAKLAEHEADWSEETIGKVRSAIGKANLLINKKCNQFKELCEKSLINDASDQYAVLNDDLAGFWDMISIQIADVKKSFESI